MTAGAALNQVKQQIAVTFDNMACRNARPGRLCSIQWLSAVAIAQSDATDWSHVGWAQHPNVFGDPVLGGMPIIDVTLIPPSGRTGSHGATQLPFFSSLGGPTPHAPFSPRTFAVEIDFEQTRTLNAWQARTCSASQWTSTPPATSASATAVWPGTTRQRGSSTNSPRCKRSTTPRVARPA